MLQPVTERKQWRWPGELAAFPCGTNIAFATLAAAYAESGDFEQALKYQKQALAMANWPDPERKDLQKRLDLYEQGEPFHEAAPQ